MIAVAVIDRNRAIGRGGELLCRLPGDLAHFKKTTLGKTVIMGRKTLDSLPGGNRCPAATPLSFHGRPGWGGFMTT
ncbi:MAG TPA: dihydrofolate reductase, partial [Anaerovoracaceae bacterium]|nr:dihydrofolate reductase [Anaerovoracaceae bacterium]